MNAVLNASSSANGCVLYSTLFPCNECAKLLIQAGIQRVVYLHDKPEKPSSIASKRLLEMAGIPFHQFTSSTRICIDFSAQPPASLQR